MAAKTWASLRCSSTRKLVVCSCSVMAANESRNRGGEMKYRTLGYLAVAFVLGALMWGFIGGAALNDVRAAKQPPCIGCSVDGKTTPRTPDGHPDLSGHWGGLSGGADPGGNHISERSPDGSVLFDFGG